MSTEVDCCSVHLTQIIQHPPDAAEQADVEAYLTDKYLSTTEPQALTDEASMSSDDTSSRSSSLLEPALRPDHERTNFAGSEHPTDAASEPSDPALAESEDVPTEPRDVASEPDLADADVPPATLPSADDRAVAHEPKLAPSPTAPAGAVG